MLKSTSRPNCEGAKSRPAVHVAVVRECTGIFQWRLTLRQCLSVGCCRCVCVCVFSCTANKCVSNYVLLVASCSFGILIPHHVFGDLVHLQACILANMASMIIFWRFFRDSCCNFENIHMSVSRSVPSTVRQGIHIRLGPTPSSVTRHSAA